MLEMYNKEDMHGFLVKNLDLDFKFYNLAFWLSKPTKEVSSLNFFLAESFSSGSIYPKIENKKFWKSKKNIFFSIIPHMDTTWYLSMDHITGNKMPMGSIEVPIDREYPDKEPVKLP